MSVDYFNKEMLIMKKLINFGLSVIACSAIANISTADQLEEVVVTSSLIDATASEISNPIHVLNGKSISSDATQSIGSLIDGLVGVSSSDFSAAVGQPVIRGLSGSRVKLLNNGKVVRDVSSLGPDHSNEIDLGHLQQIEIVRGPSSLLYANGAVGGIVNIVDNTIAKQDIQSPRFNLGAGYEDGNGGNTGNASYVGNIGGINLTSSFQYSNLGNYAIPEHAVIDAHEGEAGHDDDHEHDAKTLENSDFAKFGAKLGASKVGDWGYVGLSYADSSSTYGIPFHGEHDHCEEHPDDCETPEGGGDPVLKEGVEEEEEEERIFAKTNSETINFEGSYNLNGSLVKRADYYIRSTSYDHTEQHAEEHHHEEEGPEAAGEEEHEPTLFKNKSDELGLTLDIGQAASEQKLTINFAQEEVLIDGEEKFLDNTKSDEITLGYFISNDIGAAHVDFGVRYDQIDRKSVPGNFDDNLLSFSTVLSRGLSDNLNVSLGLSSVQKAPSAIELFVAGDHMVTQRYEIGDPNQSSEKANNIDLSFETNIAGFDANLNLYRNNISNFIYADDLKTDEVEDAQLIRDRLAALGKTAPDNLADLTELEVSAFKQKDAVFEGYELQFSKSIALESGSLKVSVARDYVDAQFKEGGYIPRMVPTRNILNLSYNGNNDLDWTVSIKDVQKQSKIASEDHDEDHVGGDDDDHHGETSTEGFKWVNFNLTKSVTLSANEELELSFFAKNLLNEVARNHSSFVKDAVPLAGRNIGVRFNYSF